jgi:hypothetical protein
MRDLFLSVALVAGLILPVGAAHAQSTPTATATCKDGTAFTGTKRSGACRGHGGVQSWGEASTAASPVATPAPSTTTTSQRTAPSPGGGAGQVWVNTASKVYHCPGDRWYGKTKHGSYNVRSGGAGTGRSAGPRQGLPPRRPIEGRVRPLAPGPTSIGWRRAKREP